MTDSEVNHSPNNNNSGIVNMAQTEEGGYYQIDAMFLQY